MGVGVVPYGGVSLAPAGHVVAVGVPVARQATVDRELDEAEGEGACRVAVGGVVPLRAPCLQGCIAAHMRYACTLYNEVTANAP